MRHPRPANCPKRIPLSGEFRSRDLKFSRISYLCIVAVLYLAASRPAKAQESLVYSFSTPNCSAQPDSAPVFDSKGNIFGTCGDNSGNGYVYELSPSGAGGWTAQTIYTFGAGNSTATGSGPNGLIFDSNKVNLYGTTSAGGTNSAGVVYELSPKTGGGWTQTVLYSFGTNGLSDGNEPLGTLVFDTAGNLYGTTFGGGANFDSGTIFELSPGTGNTWTETVIHSFSFIDSNGSNPRNGLLIDASGNLFGTTSSNSGGGTAFELSPAGGGSWTLQTLAVLATNAVGNQIFDSSGNIYGVCKGGFESDGFAYELEKGAGGIWTPLLLYSFGQSATDGTAPVAGVVLGPKGVLYGTTVTGGLYGGIASPSGYGTIYELIPGSPWTEKPLYNFNDSANNDGYGPNSDLALDSSGNIYGSASGGLNAAGTVFELTNPSTVEVPQFSPPPGTYIQPPSVEITDPTPNSVIYYTTTGVAPTTSSTKYTGAITVSATETIEAIAVASGLTNSPVAKATYTITPPAATPAFSPVAGTYPSAQQVTISDSTKGATIYYATNATPTTSSTKFSTAIPVNATETLEAIAIAPGYSVSNVGTASFTIETPATTPVISPAAGTYDSAQPVTITDTTPNAVIYYTTNGTSPTTASTKYGGAFTVSASATVEAIAIAPGYDPSLVATAKYVITPPAATPTFTPPAGTYASAQTVTIASATKGALIFYTTNGVAPTVNSAKYTAPIAISKTATLKAVAIDTGYSLSNVGSALYTIETPAAPPVISLASGAYTGAQSIAITDATPGATIYFTTNGTTPTTSSTKYFGPFPFSSAVETVEAIAVAPGYTPSPVEKTQYSIAWLEKVLDNTWPSESYGLVMDAKGNLYTTTFHSGANNAGAVFELSPAANGTWTQKLLYSFGSYTGDGTLPEAGLTIDSAGNLYGTTTWSGKYGTTYNNGGTVFELSPAANGTWTEKVLYSFGGPGANGTAPVAAPTLDAKGNLYGTTNNSANGGGTVYELSPAANGTWNYKLLYAFGAAANDGSSPFDSVILDANGNVYGTTYSGGAHGNGNVFELTPTATGPWTEKVLYNFGASSTDGQDSFAGLTFDSHGNLFGTTNLGGTHSAGIAFELTPTATLPWTEKVLYNFGASETDSSGTGAGLVFDSAGNLYGSAGGGAYGKGTVFQLSPAAGAVWTETILHNFGITSSDGTSPSSLIIDAAGNLYGTTTQTGGIGGSTVFEIETTTTAAPVFSPGAGTYAPGQKVALTDGTPGSTIYYTVNGATPTTASYKYTAPFVLSASVTLKAIATASGYTNSAVATAPYLIGAPTATPVISPAAGTYNAVPTITLTDATANAVIYYTTDGSIPTTFSAKYTAAFKIAASATIKAIAAATGHPPSGVATSSFILTLPAAAPVFTPAAGSYTSAQTVTITDATPGAVIYYTTNSTTPTTASTKYSGAIAVDATETIEAIATAPGFLQSPVAAATYKVPTPAATPTFSPASGAYFTSQTVTIADPTPGAAIYYTLDGSQPTTSSAKYKSPIAVAASAILNALAVAPGYLNSLVGSAPYAIGETHELVLHSFGSTATDGYLPLGGLNFDAEGNLYGTTHGGGNYGLGTVFELSPAANGRWTENILFSFGATSSDLAWPSGGLVFDAKGNLYGQASTSVAGKGPYGGVFKLSPATTLPWKEQVLSNGGGKSTLVFDSQGNLYGATDSYGQYGYGTVFELSPAAGSSWTTQILHSFDPADSTKSNPGDGANPVGGVVFDANGNLYGMTQNGGEVYFINNAQARGTFYKLAAGIWQETVLGRFASIFGPASIQIFGGSAPIIDSAGNLYATIGYPSVVVKGPAGGGQQVLYTFGATDVDGNSPWGSLVFDAAGNLYGTTYGGGAFGYGTVFELSPTSTGSWNEKILFNFNIPDGSGAVPCGNLIFDAAGNLYGTTSNGGDCGSSQLNGYTGNGGTVFELQATAKPYFTPAAGTYAAGQTIKIADDSTGAVIYYTTDGSQPTTASTKYTAPIAFTGTETIRAIAVAPTYLNSAVASAAYIIPPPATITLTPATLAFPNTTAGIASAPLPVTVKNTGTGSVTLTSISITGTGATQFQQLNNCGAALASGASCTVYVSFSPSSVGAETATLSVVDSAKNSPQTAVLTGTAIAADTVKLSATTLTFAATKVGASAATQSVTLTNAGTVALNIASIAITGANASSFSDLSTCGGTLAAGASCLIDVSFKPAATGALAGSLTITDSGAASPQIVKLAGTGAS